MKEISDIRQVVEVSGGDEVSGGAGCQKIT